MKITGIEVIPLKTGPAVVRVSTDEGISGIGEVSHRNQKLLKRFIEDVLGDVVIGKDPRMINRQWEEMFFTTSRLGPMGLQPTCIGAVDIACWDIFGKAVGMPLYDLLGGAARTRIKVYLSTGLGWQMEPKEMLLLRTGYIPR